MLNYMRPVFSSDIAIDLGTSNTLLLAKGRGILVNEPSVVAINQKIAHKNRVVAVGREAKDMLGRTPLAIEAIRPIQKGVIADFDATVTMLKHFIGRSKRTLSLMKPRAVIAVPVGITEVEKRAVKESAELANAGEVYLIEEPMAAAIGAGMPITEPYGNMIVDIGGGTTEVAVISLGGIVFSRSIRIGGEKLDESIVTYIKKRYSLLIGDRTAEQIKIRLGSAYAEDPVTIMEVKGRDVVAGIPKTIEIASDEIREALNEPLMAIVEAIRLSLERTPPELGSDIVDRGIVLSGGGALLRNLPLLIQKETGVSVSVAPDPLCGTVLGAGRVLEELDQLKRVLTS